MKHNTGIKGKLYKSIERSRVIHLYCQDGILEEKPKPIAPISTKSSKVLVLKKSDVNFVLKQQTVPIKVKKAILKKDWEKHPLNLRA